MNTSKLLPFDSFMATGIQYWLFNLEDEVRLYDAQSDAFEFAEVTGYWN